VHGEVLCGIGYSRLSPARRLEAFVQLIALAATGSGVRRALTIGRVPASRDAGERVAISRLDAGEHPLGLLETVVDLYRRGMREPVPLFCDTSEAFAEARRRGADDPARVAAGKWRPQFKGAHAEADRDEHAVVFGSASLDDVLAELPSLDEDGDGWCADEPTRFGRYARRLWDPLVACERREER
jgi:exodeoxyribonuclease V gamma subunit